MAFSSIFLILIISYPMIIIGKLTKCVDLGWDYHEDTVNWPTTAKFKWTKKIEGTANDWYAMNEFCVGEHVGTHLDAPYHFYTDGWKVGDIPLDKLIKPGICINVGKYRPNIVPDFILTPDHIREWEAKNGKIDADTIVIVNFNWTQYYGSPTYFNNMTFPSISEKAAQLLAKRKISGVGLDAPSVDFGTSTINISHRILSQKNIFIIENLKLPQEFEEKGYTLFVMPIKLRDGTGGPTRVIAVPDEKHKSTNHC